MWRRHNSAERNTHSRLERGRMIFMHMWLQYLTLVGDLCEKAALPLTRRPKSALNVIPPQTALFFPFSAIFSFLHLRIGRGGHNSIRIRSSSYPRARARSFRIRSQHGTCCSKCSREWRGRFARCVGRTSHVAHWTAAARVLHDYCVPARAD